MRHRPDPYARRREPMRPGRPVVTPSRRSQSPSDLRRARQHTVSAWAAVGVLAALLGTAVATAQDGTPAPSPSITLRTPLTVGLGYIPNVQFAQFYRAELA